MAGISHVLSVAKEALLTHQLSIQVASHNIANVDTPGYTRQTLQLETHNATPISSGMLGGGVKASTILRNYDQFMVQRLAGQESKLGSLESQQQSMRLVEAVFNEAPGLAINDLMNQFWSSWQDLADNPETSATRQSVIQSSQLIIDQLHTMASEITQARFDIGVSLDTAINDVNSIVSQIANLNVQITGAETAAGQANDLRDERDTLIRNLSNLLDVTFFEDKNGAYTVLMADGHSLVTNNEAWQVDWENDDLIWVSKDAKGVETRRPIGGGADLGGKIGGWLEVMGNLVEGDPDNFLGRLDAFANALVREVNQQHSQGVGLTLFGDVLTGSEQAKETAVLTSTLDAAPASANTSIAAGRITINSREIGSISGGLATNGLAMSKTANAVTAINAAEAGVEARLTTLVAGTAVSAMAASPANDGATLSLEINGVAVNYTIDNNGALPDDSDAATFAANLAAAVNSAITAHNASASNPVTILAEVGTGANGGALNSLVFKNTNAGDQSAIVIGNLDSSVLGLATSMGLTAGSYNAGAANNTGQITLFSTSSFTLNAGANDYILAQLGLTGATVAFDEQANDGTITYGPEISSQGALLAGYDYFDTLDTSGSFDIWIYNNDGSLAMSQPVTISLERAYSLNDVTSIINKSVAAATGGSGWITASSFGNSLRLTPDANHQFAFANDSSNFLQVAGLNTFFSGSSAASIGLNSTISGDLNKLAAAAVGSRGEIFRGDNSNSLKITTIQHDEYVSFTGGNQNTLDGFYNVLVGTIANTSRTISHTYDSAVLVNNQLNEMRDSVSGVSLDEEMANLIKYQHAYTAAARLITMSDEMLQTLLDSVR